MFTLLTLVLFLHFLYAFQDREFILRIFEEISGARLLYNYIWLGGVWNDISDSQLKRIESFLDEVEENIKKYHTLVGENKIFIGRTANVGVVSKEMAMTTEQQDQFFVDQELIGT